MTTLYLAIAASLYGQTKSLPVTFDGQIRVRSEADGRDFNNDSDINTYTLMRTRFGARANPTDDVTVYVQIQDSRAFGTEPSTLASTANLDVHQAYFQVSNLWDKNIDLKVGRQEMVYGSQRLIGNVGWSNTGRSFDGVKLSFGKNNNFDLFSMIINEANTPVLGPATPATTAGRESADNSFVGAYYKHRPSSRYKLDVYGLFQSNTQNTLAGDNELNRATVGTYNKGKLNKNLDFETELALQLGKRRGQDVSAYLLSGSVGYTFKTQRKPSVRIGYDYLSGMESGDEDFKAFDTLFATNHKFYGFMDYFINIPVNASGRGLQDFMLKAKIPFGKNWNLNAHYHNFRAAKGAEKNFGNELDLVLNYAYNSVASFQFGLAFFVPGDLVENSFLNDDIGVWSFTTMLVKF